STRLSALGATLTTVSARRGADPRHLNRAVHGELDWIAMKALEKDRSRRYETAGDFAADLARYLTDRPVEACPPSAWYRLGQAAWNSPSRPSNACGPRPASRTYGASNGIISAGSPTARFQSSSGTGPRSVPSPCPRTGARWSRGTSTASSCSGTSSPGGSGP